MYRLVVVVLVAVFVQVGEGILENLVDSGLTPSRGTHTHQPMANQLGLVQLDDFTDLGRGERKRISRRISVGSQYSYRSGSLCTNHKLPHKTSHQMPTFQLLGYSLQSAVFCPDEDRSPAVETSAFDEMFCELICGW